MAYDRRGHRRLGALVGEGVVDLADVVGHPAFPATMELLVSRNGGTVLDAARAALERNGAPALPLETTPLLAPLMPSSLRSLHARHGERAVVGPDDELRWPDGGRWLDYAPKVAAIIGRPGRDLELEEAAAAIFGYALVNDFVVRDESGRESARQSIPVALGPCIATLDEVDPPSVTVVARVDGEPWARRSLAAASGVFADVIARASGEEELGPGDAFAVEPFGISFAEDLGKRLHPGALVELEADGIGALRSRIGRRD